MMPTEPSRARQRLEYVKELCRKGLPLDGASLDFLLTCTALVLEFDEMDPDDWRTGQQHLAPAFRAVNYRDAMLHVMERINATLGDEAFKA